MQEQIQKLNKIASSEDQKEDIRDYCKALANILQAIDNLNKKVEGIYK